MFSRKTAKPQGGKKRFIRQERALRTDARKGRNKIAQGIALGDGIFDDFKL